MPFTDIGVIGKGLGFKGKFMSLDMLSLRAFEIFTQISRKQLHGHEFRGWFSWRYMYIWTILKK